MKKELPNPDVLSRGFFSLSTEALKWELLKTALEIKLFDFDDRHPEAPFALSKPAALPENWQNSNFIAPKIRLPLKIPITHLEMTCRERLKYSLPKLRIFTSP